MQAEAKNEALKLIAQSIDILCQDGNSYDEFTHDRVIRLLKEAVDKLAQ